MISMKMMVPVLLGIIVTGTQTQAQLPHTSGADTSRNSGASKKITDTGFVYNGIKQQILDIQLAQMAMNRASTPRVKQLARNIVADGRDNLRRLLALADTNNLRGVSRDELDAAMKDVKTSNTISASDPAAAATTGNTVTDSLGSGSSGSGNVVGDDTGTLSRTRSGISANYSEQGEYAYNNNLFMNEAEVLDAAKGKSFDAKWVRLMLKIHQGKIDHYNQASAQVKDPQVRMAITQSLPKIRMHNGTLLRLSKDKDLADGMNNQEGQDDKINSGALEGDNSSPAPR